MRIRFADAVMTILTFRDGGAVPCIAIICPCRTLGSPAALAV